MMNIIHTEKAPQPLGHYSQAIQHNGTLYVAGQLPIHPDNPALPAEDIETQTRVALENVEAILKAAGSSKNKVLKVTIYINDMSQWKKVNQVYAEFFGKHKPARAAVPINDLPKGYNIEIDAIAAV